MGSLVPSSSSFPVSSSPSFLLPKLTPAADEWFITSNSDRLLTQALTRELSSTSASASSSSSSPAHPSLEPSENKAFLHRKLSDGFPQLQAQVGSPASSNSICKEMPESPFNTYSSTISAMSNLSSMPNLSPTTESFITHNYQAPQGFESNLSILKPGGSGTGTPDTGTPSSISSLFSSQAPSIFLSSQASAGAGVTKVSKRRSRSNKKAPIAVLSADTSNFRAMVQQLTGIPTSHAPSHLWGNPGVSLMKPQPTKLPYNGGILDMPTLDTSASFLGSMNTPSLQNFSLLQRSHLQSGRPPLSGPLPARPCTGAELAYLQERSKSFFNSGYQPNVMNYGALFASSSTSSSSPLPLPGLWEAMESGKLSGNLTREGDQSSAMQSLNPYDSLLSLVDNDLHHAKQLSYNTVDSWLAFDGGPLANHSPRIDLAKVVS